MSLSIKVEKRTKDLKSMDRHPRALLVPFANSLSMACSIFFTIASDFALFLCYFSDRYDFAA